jgi:hypothetical protein
MICKHCKREMFAARPGQQYCDYKCSNAAKVHAPKQYDHSAIVWSCGGGVQSTAIAALICSGKLPKPDYAIMVDVGRERQSTWEYVYNHLIPKLNEVGVELIILKTTDYTNIELFSKNGCFLLPAHRETDNGRVKMTTMCNETWKVRVARRFLKEQGVEAFTNWIGISKDEARRARQSDKQSIKFVYPLIDLNMSRYGCITLINKLGWKIPPHTACWCCPNATNDEWFDLKMNYPDDWAKAVELEREVREKDPGIFFHCSMMPLDKAFE